MIFKPGFIHQIPSSSGAITGAAILAALLTVDGSGSGLDADLLDGQHGSFYTTYAETAASVAITLHMADPDPHSQYLTVAEADLLYSGINHTHRLDQITNPNANKTFTMVDNHLQFTWVAPVIGGGLDGALEIEATGNFSGDLIHIHQHTGNPLANTDLVHIEASSLNVLPLRILTSGASIAADITGRVDFTGTTGTAGKRDINLITTVTPGTGGIRIKAGNQNTDLATIELIGRRDTALTSTTVAGTLALAKHRTDAAIQLNNSLGRVIFGGNHTDGSESNIIYGGMIRGYASGNLNSAADSPIGIAFNTGILGVTLQDTTETVELPTRMTIAGSGQITLFWNTVLSGAITLTGYTSPLIINPTFQSDVATQFGLAQNTTFDPTVDALINVYGNLSQINLKKQVGTTAITIYAGYRSNLLIDAAHIVDVSNIRHYEVGGVTNNSAKAILSNIGFYCSPMTIGNTIKAFEGNIATAANRWNLYMAGTALNYLNGALLIGTTTDSSNGKIQLVDHTTAVGGIGFGTDVTLYRGAADLLVTDDNIWIKDNTKTLFIGTITATTLIGEGLNCVNTAVFQNGISFLGASGFIFRDSTFPYTTGGIISQNPGNANMIFHNQTANKSIFLQTNSGIALELTSLKSAVFNTAAIAQNATDGFPYIPSCPGIPIGVPTAFVGRMPMVYDSANDDLYLYNNGWKKAINVGAASGLSNAQVLARTSLRC